MDFESFSVPFTIPANTPNGVLSIGVAVCGDTVMEQNEHIFASFSNVTGGAICGETCAAIGTILNDEGPPDITIDNISIKEPPGTSTKTAAFTVTLNHRTPVTTSVQFATRNGTARGNINCGASDFLFGRPDYTRRSGTLTIPPNTLSRKIPVPICGDTLPLEPNETFFMDLTSAMNATIVDGTGRATILPSQ